MVSIKQFALLFCAATLSEALYAREPAGLGFSPGVDARQFYPPSRLPPSKRQSPEYWLSERDAYAYGEHFRRSAAPGKNSVQPVRQVASARQQKKAGDTKSSKPSDGRARKEAGASKAERKPVVKKEPAGKKTIGREKAPARKQTAAGKKAPAKKAGGGGWFGNVLHDVEGVAKGTVKGVETVAGNKGVQRFAQKAGTAVQNGMVTDVVGAAAGNPVSMFKTAEDVAGFF